VELVSANASLCGQVWWTAADEAELRLLVHELVRAAWIHRDRCESCRAENRWCEPLAEAFDAVWDWRAGRILRSQAAWLRAREDEQRAAA
jgi:hypothetical protein